MTKPTLFKNRVELEKCEKFRLYKFTLNPEQTKGETLDTFRKSIFKWFTHFKFANFTYCIEASPTGRLHIHGWIAITNIKEFYCGELPQLAKIQGFMSPANTEWDAKGTYKTWDEYCYKQQHIIKIGWETVINQALDMNEDKDKPCQKRGMEDYKYATEKQVKIIAPPNSPVSDSEASENDDDEGYDLNDPDDDNDDITE